AAAEDVVADRLDALQDAGRALHGGADLEPEATRKLAPEARARGEQRTGALYLQAHELPPGAVAGALDEVKARHPEARHVVLRQIDPVVLGEVDRHVLPEVHELERRADRVGALLV